MPHVVTEKVQAYAHCPNARCVGYLQEEVPAERVETNYLYTDNGGDLPGVERSNSHFRWPDGVDVSCPGCGGLRELSASPRPSYQPLSGYDPMGLLGAAKFNPAKVNTEADARVAALEAQLASQGELLTQLLEKLGGAD